MPHRSLITVLAGALASLALIGPAQAQVPAQSPESRHVRAELIADSASIQPGGTIHVALRQTIAPGWHTYWRNPGDSGQATSVTWTLPEGWKTGELTWPTPRQLRTGPLMDYGYEGVAILPQTLTAPSDAKAGQSVTLRAAAAFLVCKDVCVPEDAALTLTLPVGAGAPDPDPKGGAAIAATLAAAPRAGPLTAVMTASGAVLKLSVTGAPVKGGDFPGAYFYPYDASVIDHPQPQTLERGPGGLTLTLAPGSAFKTGPAPTHLQGVLDLGGKAYEIDAKPGPAQPSAAGLGAVSAAAPSGGGEAGGPKGGLAVAIAFAFLGGLILNLMPCVFPVLSMKAVSLASHAHTPQAARLQGLAFLVGVVITFVGLAGLLIAVRAAGQAVGWGFQLQSPIVIAGLTLVMLGVALNLAGLFEIGAGVQSAAGGVQVDSHGETLGAFLTGVLAVAVAAPCTAPFMAPAIGFAFTQPPAITLSVFLALGLGMAAPFTLAAFAPPLLALLPRPGAWMGVFKQVMAFPMFATAAWLLWVFSQQVGPIGLAGLLTGAVLVALAAWIYGRAQSAQIAGKGGTVGFLVTAVLVLAAGAAALTPTLNPDRAGAATAQANEGEGLTAEAFSPDRLAELRAAGKPVFVNFTAAWCVTCQVNDKVALSSRKVAEAFKRGGVVYLKGDWTNRDAVIAKVLSDHGRAGVPLYLFYGAGGRDAAVLPQILTEGIVLDAAAKAARP